MTEGTLGPKAASLARLRQAGLPVPEARVLSGEVYREHVRRAGIETHLRALAGDWDLATIHEALLAIPLDTEVVSQLRAWHAELGGGPVAVRSSATAEDLPQASFAGQHGTYFTHSRDDLPGCVKACWASLFSERAFEYRERRGMRHDLVDMAVIVQRLVDARAAGVAFTADPVTGARRVVVEACLGIGETLVSGKVTPDRFVFEPEGLSLHERVLGDKRVELIIADGVVVEREVGEERAAAPAVDNEVAVQAARLALAAEGLLGRPADVEWAWDGERVWLLQARPVTAVVAVSEPRDSATVTDAGAPPVVWSNVNTGEILPDVVTPMTWSAIHGHAQEIFGGMFGALGVDIDATKLIGLIAGRVYFNASLVAESFEHIPGGMGNIAELLGGMHDYVELPDMETAHRSRRTGRRLALARMGPRSIAYIRRYTPKRAAEFCGVLRRGTDAALDRLAAATSEDEVAALLDDLLGRFGVVSEALAYAAVAMTGYQLLAFVCKRWLGDATGSMANALIAGRGDVLSAEAGMAIWGLAEEAAADAGVRTLVEGGDGWAELRSDLAARAYAGDAGARAFLERWRSFMHDHGHHTRGEFEFANSRWADEPDYILGIVRGYLANEAGESPREAHERRGAEAEELADECRAKLRNPLKRAIFERVLRSGRSSAAVRENVKSEGVRWLASIRWTLVELGARMAARGALEQPDDVYYLTHEELRAVGAGRQRFAVKDTVARRRGERERNQRLSPPPVVVGAWDEREVTWRVPDEARVLRGIAVSAGVARGPAHVFASVDTDETVLPGEILVAPFTDPGWTPYFVPAAGIVMDMGGLLSHGSVIAREYGIPAVVNVGPATHIIKTGQLIEVDANAGEVRILEE